jgi:hypothetical protein
MSLTYAEAIADGVTFGADRLQHLLNAVLGSADDE